MKKLLYTLLTISISSFLVAQTDPVICNPGFENDLKDWTSNDNGEDVAFSFETTDIYAGNQSLLAAVNTAADWQNRIESCNMVFQTGHRYDVLLR